MSPRRRYPRPLIYEHLVAERLFDPLDDKEVPMARHYDEDGDGIADPPSTTAGEQDHTNPWVYAGAAADPPTNPDGDQ